MARGPIAPADFRGPARAIICEACRRCGRYTAAWSFLEAMEALLVDPP
jgi:hypothetical protein